MNRIGYSIKIVLILVVTLGTSCPLKAGGLSTQLGEVVIENLQVGQSYNLKQLADLSLIVTNKSEFPVDLRMDVVRPSTSELRQGAAAIPDTSWVKLSKTLFTVETYQNAVSDITISIPDDDRFLGKKYQVMIWSHTLGGKGGGMFLAYGLKSRIIFTTDSVKASSSDLVTSSDASVNLTVRPEQIFVHNVTLGTRYDVEKESGVILTIANPSQHARTLRLQSQTINNSLATLTDGYEDAPDASYLSFSENEFTVPANGTKSIRMFLEFPQRAEYRGKRYMFIIHALALHEKVTTGVYSRLYMSTL